MDPSFRHMMNRKQFPGKGWREWSPKGNALFAGHMKPETTNHRSTNNAASLYCIIEVSCENKKLLLLVGICSMHGEVRNSREIYGEKSPKMGLDKVGKIFKTSSEK
jgi:hypothetical protein